MNSDRERVNPIKKSEKGATIMAVSIMIMFGLFLFGAASLAKVIVSQRAVEKEVAAKQALYIAEAGITRAIWRLEQYPDWTNSSIPDALYTGELLLAGGTYDIILSSRTIDDLQIEARGKMNGTQRIIRVKVKK